MTQFERRSDYQEQGVEVRTVLVGAVPLSVADCGVRGGRLEMLDKKVNRYSASCYVSFFQQNFRTVCR